MARELGGHESLRGQAKLKELQAVFDAEARKNQVFLGVQGQGARIMLIGAF